MDANQREEFREELYAKQGTDETAKDQLREHMAALGIEWDGEV